MKDTLEIIIAGLINEEGRTPPCLPAGLPFEKKGK